MNNVWTTNVESKTVPANARIRGFVVSDTHFGAPYSDSYDADIVLEKGLEANAREGLPAAKFCVLLGDIYENLNLSVKRTPEAIETLISNHMTHLRKMVERHSGCKFIYVIGNHERVPEFDIAIDKLARELGPEHLEITRHFRKIGDALFIHGDQAMNPAKYHVDETKPNQYDGKDGRYKAGEEEMGFTPPRQWIENLGNVNLPFIIGRILHTAKNAPKKFLIGQKLTMDGIRESLLYLMGSITYSWGTPMTHLPERALRM